MAEITNKSLDKVIRRDEAARAARDANDDAQLLIILNTQSIMKTDNTPRDSNWITNQLGANADCVLGTIQAATIPRAVAANAKLAGDGVDISNPQVQAMLPQLAAAVVGTALEWPEGLLATVLGWGVWYESPIEDKFDQRGLAVSAEQLAAWRQWYDIEKRLTDNYEQTLEAVRNGDITTWDAAAAAVTA